jgi:hypothetical protein
VTFDVKNRHTSISPEELIGIIDSKFMGPDSSVGIAIHYELDGLGARFSASVQTGPWDPLSLLYNMYQVGFPGVKRPGRGVGHPPSSSTGIKDFRYTSTPFLELRGLF